MLNEEEFTKRYIDRLKEIFQEDEVQEWMTDISPDAWEMYKGDGTATPEDMADGEAEEMSCN